MKYIYLYLYIYIYVCILMKYIECICKRETTRRINKDLYTMECLHSGGTF